MTTPRPAGVVALSTVGAWGLGPGALPGAPDGRVLDLSAFEERSVARTLKLMSRGARLAALAMARLVPAAGWADRLDVGAYLGVGASGGAEDELLALLQACLVDGRFSLARFGTDGLAACNPLFAFQLMNNFTLCHGAIAQGTGGPNGAFFSRGAGTVAALQEALWALHEGDCGRALAGGADTALHPVTRAELGRDGFLAQGLVPAEAAALVALEREPQRAQAWVTGAHLRIAEDRARALTRDADLVVLAPWGDPARERLRSVCPDTDIATRLVDVSLAFGEALAASPALAWTEAVRQGTGRSVALSLGPDGDLCAVTFAKERP
jgi:hypothetical protein